MRDACVSSESSTEKQIIRKPFTNFVVIKSISKKQSHENNFITLLCRMACNQLHIRQTAGKWTISQRGKLLFKEEKGESAALGEMQQTCGKFPCRMMGVFS